MINPILFEKKRWLKENQYVQLKGWNTHIFIEGASEDLLEMSHRLSAIEVVHFASDKAWLHLPHKNSVNMVSDISSNFSSSFTCNDSYTLYHINTEILTVNELTQIAHTASLARAFGIIFIYYGETFTAMPEHVKANIGTILTPLKNKSISYHALKNNEVVNYLPQECYI